MVRVIFFELAYNILLLTLLYLNLFAVPSDAPRNVNASSLDAMTIELVWEPPPLDTHNGIIRRYTIDIFISETRENIFKLRTDNLTSMVLTDLHPYYTYTFQIAAVTIAAGPQSVAVTARTSESGMSV